MSFLRSSGILTMFWIDFSMECPRGSAGGERDHMLPMPKKPKNRALVSVFSTGRSRPMGASLYVQRSLLLLGRGRLGGRLRLRLVAALGGLALPSLRLPLAARIV